MRVHSAIPICCTYIFVSSATLRWKQFKEYIGPFHFEPFYNSTTSVEFFVCDKIYALKNLKTMTKLISSSKSNYYYNWLSSKYRVRHPLVVTGKLPQYLTKLDKWGLYLSLDIPQSC